MHTTASKLSQVFGRKELPAVIASLRQDPLVWNSMQEGDLLQKSIAAFGKEMELWNPAFIALLSLGQKSAIDRLQAKDYSPFPSEVVSRAAEVLNEMQISRPVSATTITLDEVALLTAALYEKRRAAGSWKGLFDDIHFEDVSMWGTALAGLLSIIPDTIEYLAELSALDEPSGSQLLPIHAVLTQPYPESLQTEVIYDLLSRLHERKKLALLKYLSRQRPSIAKTVAAQLLLDDGIRSPDALGSFSMFEHDLYTSELNRIAGNYPEAGASLNKAWSAFESLKMEFTSDMALAALRDQEAEFAIGALDSISTSQEYAQDPSRKFLTAQLAARRIGGKGKSSERAIRAGDPSPIDLLFDARAEMHRGDMDAARSLLRKSYLLTADERASGAQGSEDFAHLLMEGLMELELYPEAEEVSQIILSQNPNDTAALSELGHARLHNHVAHSSIDAAWTALSLDPENDPLRRDFVKLLVSTRQWKAALDQMNALLDSQEDPTADDLFLKADIALHAGDPDETYKDALALIEKDPESGLAHTLLGEALLLKGRMDKAEESFERAIELSPQLVRPWVAKITHHEKMGNYTVAAEIIERALAAVPDSLQLKAHNGRNQRALGQESHAIECFIDAAESAVLARSPMENCIEEDCLSIFENLQEMNRPSLSKDFLDKAIAAFPGHPGLEHANARLLLERGEVHEGLRRLESVAILNENDPEVLFDIARIHIDSTSDAEKARDAIDKALQISPDHPIGLVLNSLLEGPSDNHEHSIRLYNQALEDKVVASVYWQKYLIKRFAETAMQAGKPEIAIDKLQASRSVIGADEYLLKILTEAYRLAGLPQDALQTAKIVYHAKDDDLEILEWYSEQAILLGAPDQAVAALEKAVETQKGDARLLVEIGKIYAHNQKPEAAITTFERILKSKDISPVILHSAAGEIMALQEPAAAVPFLQKALQLSSQPSMELLQDLVGAQEHSGDLHGALMTVSQQLEIAPGDTSLHQKKAEIEISLGNFEQALDSINRSLEIEPDNLSLLSRSAKLHRRIGDLPAAAEHARRALALDPGNVALLYQAADIQRAAMNLRQAWDLIKTTDWSIEDLESIGAKRAEEPLVEALCLQAELSLDMGQYKKAEKLIESTLTNDHPRITALQARLAAFHGDKEDSRQKFSTAINSLDTADGKVSPDTVHGIALAAVAVNDWETAVRLSRDLVGQEEFEPLYSFSYAKTLILRAEHQRLCDAVEAVAMAPGIQALNDDAYHQAKQALEKTAARIEGDESQVEMARWKGRAELVFDKSIPVILEQDENTWGMDEVAAHVKALARQGNHAAAIELALEQREYPVILAALADLFAEDDLGRAHAYAVKAVDLDATPINRARLAFIADGLGREKEALSHISSALEEYPLEPHWNLLAGKLDLSSGRLHAAADCLKKAVEFDPELEQAHIYLGRTLLALGDHQNALTEFESVENRSSGQIDVIVGLAEGHMMGGNLDLASKYSKKAIDLAPDLVQPKLIEARIAVRSKKYDRALDLTSEALALTPDDPHALAVQFEVLLGLDRQDEALEAITKAIDLSPDPVPFLLQKAGVIIKSQGLEAGLDELRAAALNHPNDAKVLGRLSEALFEAGEVDEAIIQAQSALKSPHVAGDAFEAGRLHLMLGRQLDEAGQLDQAIHHLAEAIRLAPNDLEAYLEAGRVQQKRRRTVEALDYYKQAFSLAPSDHRPFLEAGMLYKEIKDFKQAEHMLRRASDLAPKNALIQRHLAATITLNLVHPNTKFRKAEAEA